MSLVPAAVHDCILLSAGKYVEIYSDFILLFMIPFLNVLVTNCTFFKTKVALEYVFVHKYQDLLPIDVMCSWYVTYTLFSYIL